MDMDYRSHTSRYANDKLFYSYVIFIFILFVQTSLMTSFSNRYNEIIWFLRVIITWHERTVQLVEQTVEIRNQSHSPSNGTPITYTGRVWDTKQPLLMILSCWYASTDRYVLKNGWTEPHSKAIWILWYFPEKKRWLTIAIKFLNIWHQTACSVKWRQSMEICMHYTRLPMRSKNFKILYYTLMHNFCNDGTVFHAGAKLTAFTISLWDPLFTIKKNQWADGNSIYFSFNFLFVKYINSLWKIISTSSDWKNVSAFLLSGSIYSVFNKN